MEGKKIFWSDPKVGFGEEHFLFCIPSHLFGTMSESLISGYQKSYANCFFVILNSLKFGKKKKKKEERKYQNHNSRTIYER